jgi:hypothetical protein
LPDDPTGQAPTDPATPPADPAPPADPPADPPTDPADPADPPSGDSDQVKQLRAEAAARRKELRETQAKLKEFEEAQLSEQEKLTKRATEAEQRATQLEQRAQDALLRATVTAEAAKAGITDTDAARLLLPSVGQVEYDQDSGEPVNVADLVKQLVDAKPYLVAQDDGPAPRDPRTQRTTPATPKRSAGKFTEAQVRSMSPQEIAALSPDDYQAAMSALARA